MKVKQIKFRVDINNNSQKVLKIIKKLNKTAKSIPLINGDIDYYRNGYKWSVRYYESPLKFFDNKEEYVIFYVNKDKFNYDERMIYNGLGSKC